MTTRGSSSGGWSTRSIATRVALLAGGTLWVLALELTTDNGDPFDSPLYWWGWLVLPVCAFIGARLGVERTLLAWGITLALPLACWTLVGGTLLSSQDEGASFWIVGELFVFVWAGLIAMGAAIGANWTEPRSEQSTPPA
jgi:hypothetical protein